MSLTSHLENILTRLKGRPFVIDRRIPLRVLLTILLRRAIWLLRGLVKTTFLMGKPAMVFIGPRVMLRNASLCTFSKGVTLEAGVLIDGLSSEGIHFGASRSNHYWRRTQFCRSPGTRRLRIRLRLRLWVR